MLGKAEMYMIEMMDCKSAAKRIQYMIFKRHFPSQASEIEDAFQKIEAAAVAVKGCLGFRKVLKTILKVGNQMNDGEDHLGFTLDSLLKLQSAKAFDNKTSILQYVVTVVMRNDPTSLTFPEELNKVCEVSRLQIDAILLEKNELQKGLRTSCTITNSLHNSGEDVPDIDVKAVQDSVNNFLAWAKERCDSLDTTAEKMRQAFLSLLEYFGEDPKMSTQDFFSTLHKFIEAFIGVREVVHRQQKAEDRKRLQEEKQKEREKEQGAVVRRTQSGLNVLEQKEKDQQKDKDIVVRRSQSDLKVVVSMLNQRQTESKPTENTSRFPTWPPKWPSTK